MSISFVQVFTGTRLTTPARTRFTTNANVNVGDLLMVLAGRGVTQSGVTAPDVGWQHVPPSPDSNGSIWAILMWKIAEVADASATLTFTITGQSDGPPGFLAQYRSSDPILRPFENPFYSQLFHGLALAKTHINGPVTSPHDGSMAVAMFVNEQGNGLTDTGTGWTQRATTDSAGNFGLRIHDKPLNAGASSGTRTYSITLGGIAQSRWFSIWMVALNAPLIAPENEPAEEHVAESELTPSNGTEAFSLVDSHSEVVLAMAYEIKQGDTTPPLAATLKQNKAIKDLTNATSVSLRYRRKGDTTITVKTAAVTGATTGQVAYTWIAGDTAVAGRYEAEWFVTYADTTTQTFPTGGYMEFLISEKLANPPIPA